MVGPTGRCVCGLAALALACSLGRVAVAKTTNYKYDALGRLISVTYPNGATNSYSYDAAGNRTVAVIGGPIQITTTTLPTPEVGATYNQTISTSGGTAPITFSVSSGALPAGLTLSSSGVITGTPTTAGAFSFTVTATDANAGTAAQAYSGAVGYAVSITTSSLSLTEVGVAFSQTITTSGGTAPVVLSISSGSLPAGLTLNASMGAITGTPTAAGGYSFTITARDAYGSIANQAFTGTVIAGFSITTTSLPAATTGTAYGQTLSTAGGSGAVTFSVSSGSLPPGLSINTALPVSLSGTPTAAGSYSFTIRATDGVGDVATQSFSLPVALNITPTSLPLIEISAPYSATIGAQGGTAPVHFSITAGSLPAGLSLNSTSGLISGTPTTGGPSTVTIAAVDANGLTASRQYNDAVVNPITMTTQSLPSGVVGTPYSQAISVSGGVPPITFSTGDLPYAGLTLNAATGVISGTPTIAGAFSVLVTASDVNGESVGQEFNITISH